MKSNMLKRMEKLTNMLAASAFAELGDFASARNIIDKDHVYDEQSGVWEKEQVAISFAEASEFDTAREIMGEHDEYPVHPDDCQFGDNDLCYSQA